MAKHISAQTREVPDTYRLSTSGSIGVQTGVSAPIELLPPPNWYDATDNECDTSIPGEKGAYQTWWRNYSEGQWRVQRTRHDVNNGRRLIPNEDITIGGRSITDTETQDLYTALQHLLDR